MLPLVNAAPVVEPISVNKSVANVQEVQGENELHMHLYLNLSYLRLS